MLKILPEILYKNKRICEIIPLRSTYIAVTVSSKKFFKIIHPN
ncbi:hypothetical protein MTR67_039322 [Solanum verrucosum]|uniref:Uncharacterized protein n=1 Tax=Solanum verrucosum TaxID=315347 RepID=A0AAF0UH02_SOLVR|nr:hypothetical protein MTR67_039322 [Solanum verrucosum]